MLQSVLLKKQFGMFYTILKIGYSKRRKHLGCNQLFTIRCISLEISDYKKFFYKMERNLIQKFTSSAKGKMRPIFLIL